MITQRQNGKTDAFLATVISGAAVPAPGLWVVQPLITEYTGLPTVQQSVFAIEGLTPAPGDTVLVVTNRNAAPVGGVVLPINRYFEATEANGVIIGIVVGPAGYTLTGNFSFLGDLRVSGNLFVGGALTVIGDATIAGHSFMQHEHDAGAALISASPGSPVTGFTAGIHPAGP